MNSFLIYLLQVSVCHTGFYILYSLVFSKHTFFQTNRFYLLTTTLLSFVIPLLSIEFWNAVSVDNSFITQLSFIPEKKPAFETQSVLFNNNYGAWKSNLVAGIILSYIAGFLFNFIKLMQGIWKVTSLIKKNKAVDDGAYKLIWLKNGPAFFTFFKYIFINDKNIILSSKEFSHVLAHEKIHVQQGHTYDVFLMEIASAICWFNPLMRKIKNEIRQIHEFIADQQVISFSNDSDQYSRLILRLSTNNHTISFTHQFSKINVKNRIIMLNQTKNHAMKNLNYLLTIPMILLLMSFFSFSEKTNFSDISDGNPNEEQLTIGEISWKGNTKYSDDFLTEYLGIEKGDEYNKQEIENKFIYNPMIVGIPDLYMDSGYLYFRIDKKEDIIGNSINLTFEIFEGSTAFFDKIIIKGNANVKTNKVLEMIEFKKGDLFNRSKLIQSQKNIANSGLFKKDEVGIDPIPHSDYKLVDIEFVLIELE